MGIADKLSGEQLLFISSLRIIPMMNQYSIGQALAPYRVTGYNYAEQHDNRIHSDEVAAQYGFKGGLVPGVGVYAYLTQPVVAAFGIEWLQHGAVSAKFLKPLYHDEEAVVQAIVTALDPLTLKLSLINPEGVLCAVGEASLPLSPTALNPCDYPHQALPAQDQRPAATIFNLPNETILGSLEWQLDLAALEAKFLRDLCASIPLYFGADAVCHPAFYLAQANEILMANVKLGPWIHIGSEVQHFTLPNDGVAMALRGKVAETFEKRSHEIVVLDLGLFADSTPIAHIKHTAIVKLREASS